jgi:hypothetical protein
MRPGPITEGTVGIGASIFLIAAGLILAFAVQVSVAGIDLHLVGLILTGVGVLGLVVFFAIWGPHGRGISSRVVRGERSMTPDEQLVEERRIYDKGPS